MMKIWPVKTMAEVTRLVTDGKHGDCEDEENSGYYFLSSKDLQDGRLQYDRPRQITQDGFAETHRRTNLEPGDILLANCGASIGRVGIAQDDPRIYKTTFQKSVSVIKANKAIIDNRFLYYFVAFKSTLLIRLGNGAAQPNLLIGDLKRIEVPVPPLPVQLRIASILSAYDELVENSQRRIRLLEAMARALYREWFVHFRFPGHERIKRVDSPLGKIPQGWGVNRLGDVLELNYGKALKKEDRRAGEFPVYGSSGIVGTHDTSSVKGPGIIVGRKGNVGSVFWCNGDFFVIDTAYFVTSSLPLRFLFYVLPTLNFLNSDAAVPGLSRNQAYTLKILVPPDALLKRFCEFADTFERQASALQRQIQNLRRTRDLLLPRLLSGRVELKTH